MATSPRSELRIEAITEFRLSDSDGQWYWHTQAPNGKIVGDGAEGYVELRKAIAGFFVQQGFNPRADLDPAEQHYSKLYQADEAGNAFHIRRYTHGAPDPFNPDIPLAASTVGWQPEGVE